MEDDIQKRLNHVCTQLKTIGADDKNINKVLMIVTELSFQIYNSSDVTDDYISCFERAVKLIAVSYKYSEYVSDKFKKGE
jgi:hypothetical protein